MADLWNGRLLRFIAGCFVAYALVALVTDAPLLILILNDFVMSAAAGVCVAYAPILPSALKSARPTKGDFLGVGIFLVSACVLLLRIASVLARDLGYPEIYNSDAVTFSLLLGLMGAMLHLWAPNAVEGRIPRERWTSTGIVVAIGLLISLGAWTAHVGMRPHAVIELR